MVHMFIVGTKYIATLPKTRMHLVLPHLYSDSEYLREYRKLSSEGHFLMQDNSIFELGDAFDGPRLLDAARSIGATEVVVPEVLRDWKASVDKLTEFLALYRTLPSDQRPQLAAVVQGKSYSEVVQHYRILDLTPEISTIAFPFNFEFDAFDSTDVSADLKSFGWNRFSLMMRLRLDGHWSRSKSHHLLGLYNPAELSVYRDYSSLWRSLRSNDSSSCFWHSLHGTQYSAAYGLLYRKIETPVDFSAEFVSGEQVRVFDRNAELLLRFAVGCDGSPVREALNARWRGWG